jgi:hypothetical protein
LKMRQQMSEKLQKRGGQSLHDPNRDETRAPAPAGRSMVAVGNPAHPAGLEAPDRSMVPSKVNASSLRASHAVHAGSGPRCAPHGAGSASAVGNDAACQVEVWFASRLPRKKVPRLRSDLSGESEDS